MARGANGEHLLMSSERSVFKLICFDIYGQKIFENSLSKGLRKRFLVREGFDKISSTQEV